MNSATNSVMQRFRNNVAMWQRWMTCEEDKTYWKVAQDYQMTIAGSRGDGCTNMNRSLWILLRERHGYKKSP